MGFEANKPGTTAPAQLRWRCVTGRIFRLFWFGVPRSGRAATSLVFPRKRGTPNHSNAFVENHVKLRPASPRAGTPRCRAGNPVLPVFRAFRPGKSRRLEGRLNRQAGMPAPRRCPDSAARRPYLLESCHHLPRQVRLRNCCFPLDCGGDSPDETGTTGSLYCPGAVIDRLGGKIIPHGASAGDRPDSVGQTIKCKKSTLTKRWS